MKQCEICGYKYKVGIAGEQGGLHFQDIRIHNATHDGEPFYPEVFRDNFDKWDKI